MVKLLSFYFIISIFCKNYMIYFYIFEYWHDQTKIIVCSKQRLKSAWASGRLSWCQGWSGSSRDAQPHWFSHNPAHFIFESSSQNFLHLPCIYRPNHDHFVPPTPMIINSIEMLNYTKNDSEAVGIIPDILEIIGKIQFTFFSICKYHIFPQHSDILNPYHYTFLQFKQDNFINW